METLREQIMSRFYALYTKRKIYAMKNSKYRMFKSIYLNILRVCYYV